MSEHIAQKKNITLFIVLALFVITGMIYVAVSRAATPFITAEPEAGIVTAPASVVSDTTASGGSAVKFSAASSGGSCHLNTPNIPDGPDPWGGCFPGPTTTGVPAGTTLTNYTGSCTITTANTVIDAKTINCDLVINAANVTVKRSKVNGLVLLDGDLSGSNQWSLTLQDSEVDGGQQQRAVVASANMTILRANLHGGITAAQCDEFSVACVIQDSWLHGQYIPPTANWHLGGLLSNGGGNLRITHNFVVCDTPVNQVQEGCTGDINLIPNFAIISGVTIENNLLGSNIGSAYCTYGGEKSTSPYPHANHVIYRNNIFQRGTNNRCAAYGPVTDFNTSGVGNQWINNKWDDGSVVPPEL